MNRRDFIFFGLLGILIISMVFCSHEASGQTVTQKEFHSVATEIARKTNNAYSLLRIGANKTPAIITVNPSAELSSVSPFERDNQTKVKEFALSQARFASSNVLSISQTAYLSEAGTTRAGNTWISSFVASFAGVPLRERFLRMNIGALSGKVMLIRNNIPPKEPNVTRASIDRNEIIPKTRMLLGIHSEVKSGPNLVFVDEQKTTSLRLCYEIVASEPDMHEMWRLTFDATTCELIEKKSLVEHEIIEDTQETDPRGTRSEFTIPVADPANYAPLAGISGRVLAKVHLHTPFDTLTTVGLPHAVISVNGKLIEADSNGFWSFLSATYPLAIQTSFDSKLLSILRQDFKSNSVLSTTILQGNADILWDDSNSDQTERDAYYSVAFAHLADKRIDEKLVNIDQHMKVNIDIDAACNAYYTPNDTSLNFFNAGGGCSNTGQVSDVVYHEYGHRVTNARYQQAAGADWNIVDGSLGEGFADLNSAFIRDDPRIGIGFFGNNNKIIRSCDNTKKWPRDISPDIHASGEIISGAFWDLRKTIGHDLAQHLFHFMEYQMPDGIGITDTLPLEDAFSNTLIATIVTDDNDNDLSNGTPHLKEILAAFKLHNISLANFVQMQLAQVQDQDTSAQAYDISLRATYHGITGAVDKENVFVHYSTDAGKTYKNEQLKFSNDSTFVGAIPKLPAGSIVKYYASLTSPLAEDDTMTSPSRESPYSFTVGYRRIFFDDAEKDNNWSLRSSSDQAKTGLWTRAKPHGTFNDPTPPVHYIQQDTDHSAKGTMCYVTGNRVDPSGNNNPGYDDVDSGATTLTTPALELSGLRSPFVRYWYYYSNDQGQNAGIPQWQVDISSDNGNSWVPLQLTSNSTDGWTEVSFLVKDYVTPSSAVKIRFIASDFIAALVEAGVDDLEILDPVIAGPESVSSQDIPADTPYPNPVRRGAVLHMPASRFHAEFTDILGRVIPTVPSADGSIQVPINIDPGIYFVSQAGQRSKIVVEP
ncbi:MAG: hypothetical protein Q8916_11820 [Bacteroidota bacterium]|nr:hypothetical protein [Bacteroidota bacterium]MDP4231078.1 hypothetical protein [Bacteroidota bacterium]MDP4236304.1 hypothetical protein [Bacteroidota bacterium]